MSEAMYDEPCATSMKPCSRGRFTATQQLCGLDYRKEVSLDFFLVDPFEGAVRAVFYLPASVLCNAPLAAEELVYRSLAHTTSLSHPGNIARADGGYCRLQ